MNKSIENLLNKKTGNPPRYLGCRFKNGDPVYLIWSHEHSAWWRPQRAGYVTDYKHAGFYSRYEALTVCATARDGVQPGKPFNEVPVLLEDVVDFVQIQDTLNAGLGV